MSLHESHATESVNHMNILQIKARTKIQSTKLYIHTLNTSVFFLNKKKDLEYSQVQKKVLRCRTFHR